MLVVWSVSLHQPLPIKGTALITVTDDDKAAIRYKTPSITTTISAAATVKGIAERQRKEPEIKSLQSYHAGIII
jgi:hypothetical protein